MSCTRSEEAQKFYGFRVDVDPDGEPKFEFFKEKQDFEIPEGEEGVLGDIGSLWGDQISEAAFKAWSGMLHELCEKYDVDREEISVGFSDIPPSDPTCKVYVQIAGSWKREYFRKDNSPFGRWVCWHYLSRVRGSREQKGTYNLREGCLYV